MTRISQAPAGALPYVNALAAVSIVFAVRGLLQPLLGLDAPLMPFALAVLWAAWHGGRGPGLFAMGISLLLGSFSLTQPHWSFDLNDRHEVTRIGLFMIIGIGIALMGDAQRRAKLQVETDRAAKAQLLQEKEGLLSEVAANAQRRRMLIREMLASVTEGRLLLCETEDDLPKALPAARSSAGGTLTLNPHTLRLLRREVLAGSEAVGLPDERCQDLLTAVGEASMNAVTHGGGGEGRVCVDAERGVVQVWITDRGSGISEEVLHRAVLERGFTTAKSLGHGFWLILQTCDRLYLLTGKGGTTIVLEQEKTAPEPVWMMSAAELGQ